MADVFTPKARAASYFVSESYSFLRKMRETPLKSDKDFRGNRLNSKPKKLVCTLMSGVYDGRFVSFVAVMTGCP